MTWEKKTKKETTKKPSTPKTNKKDSKTVTTKQHSTNKKTLYSLEKWPKSNYEVTIRINEQQKTWYKQKTLQKFQSEMKRPWFRIGSVPLKMVEESIEPMYITSWIMENIIADTMKLIVQEHTDIRIISEAYDITFDQLNTIDKDWYYNISVKFDVFPEFKEIDTKRKNIKFEPIKVDISKDKIEEVLMTVRKQYADYQDATEVAIDSIVKVKMIFLDKDKNEIHSKSAYFWEKEIQEHKVLEVCVGKKIWDTIDIPYKETTLPISFLIKPENIKVPGSKVTTINCTIWDIKKMVLPELDDWFIKKSFSGSDIHNKKDLEKHISGILLTNTQKEELLKRIDTYLAGALPSFDHVLPNRLLQEELNARREKHAKDMWWKEKFEKYLQAMWEDKIRAMQDQMKQQAEIALHKHLCLKKICELLSLQDIDRNKEFTAEKKLYTHITWDNKILANIAESK